MRRTIISSTGSYLPEMVLNNEDLKQFPQTALTLIAQKTGVVSRRNGSEQECTSDLALKAARICLDKIDFPPEEVDGIILSTSSPDRMQPATATRVQHHLKAENAFAFDINSVCSGSTFGIFLADSLIKSKQCDNILFIASEMYSRILNKKDFSTYPYFGDGAGAILFCSDSSEEGVMYSCLKTEGGGHDVVCVPGGGSMLPFDQIDNPKNAYFKMNGKTVFSFAVTKGTEVICQLLEESGKKPDDIQCFISHQANINIIRMIAENLGVSHDRFFVNLSSYGNTASASVLIALDEAISNGVLKKGDLAVTVAFGGGLSWGANLIRI